MKIFMSFVFESSSYKDFDINTEEYQTRLAEAQAIAPGLQVLFNIPSLDNFLYFLELTNDRNDITEDEANYLKMATKRILTNKALESQLNTHICKLLLEFDYDYRVNAEHTTEDETEYEPIVFDFKAVEH
jgi:hypothetical protein